MTCDAPEFQVNSGWRPIPLDKTVLRSFDFSDYKAIKAGATISSATFEIEDNTIISVGSETISGNYVHVPITGDLVGETLLTCHVTLSTTYNETMVGGCKVVDPTDCSTW